MPDEDDRYHDRPELLPEERSVVDADEAKRRADVQRELERDDKRWLKRALSQPAGRRFIWSILEAAGTFEDRYGFVPGGNNPEATWHYRGQKDLGLRLYHSWSVRDRAGILDLLDEFHPQFPKPKSK